MTLKANSIKILDVALAQPELNQTQAYKQIHTSAKDITARTNAYKLFKKPEAQIYLQKHIETAKNRVVSLIGSEKEDIALRASEAVLDRALGKATQRTEVASTKLSINIDLTGSTE